MTGIATHVRYASTLYGPPDRLLHVQQAPTLLNAVAVPSIARHPRSRNKGEEGCGTHSSIVRQCSFFGHCERLDFPTATFRIDSESVPCFRFGFILGGTLNSFDTGRHGRPNPPETPKRSGNLRSKSWTCCTSFGTAPSLTVDEILAVRHLPSTNRSLPTPARSALRICV